MAFDFGIITGVFSAILTPITTMINGWQERKKVALENEVKLAQAKTNSMIRIMETQQTADIAWENLSISNSGWKDEYWTLILSIPAIMCFIPGMDVYVRAGFASLTDCPEWYQWAVGIAIGSAFGIRKFADFMSLKKGA
jgi:hypothetical protein